MIRFLVPEAMICGSNTPTAHKRKERVTLLDVFEEFVTYLGSMTIIIWKCCILFYKIYTRYKAGSCNNATECSCGPLMSMGKAFFQVWS